MCACDSTTASMDEPANGRLRFLRRLFAAALVEPQSSRRRLPPASTRCMEPVTVPAAPQNVSFMNWYPRRIAVNGSRLSRILR